MTDAYARAGVNIDAGNETVERYREVTSGWRQPDQLGELGGFSGLFRLPGDGKRALVGSADIYVTPYCHEAQAVSGTLAYALGAGKAIISTPYWHAAEVLDHGRGLLVPFESPAAIAKATIKLLDDDKARQAMRERAYLYARPMVWKRVAQSYMATILRARVRPAEPVQIGFAIQTNTREADQRAVSA